jgi:triacylglycerol esterase/lipase EstA (alpha/beta hydrolase family)
VEQGACGRRTKGGRKEEKSGNIVWVIRIMDSQKLEKVRLNWRINGMVSLKRKLTDCLFEGEGKDRYEGLTSAKQIAIKTLVDISKRYINDETKYRGKLYLCKRLFRSEGLDFYRLIADFSEHKSIQDVTGQASRQ